MAFDVNISLIATCRFLSWAWMQYSCVIIFVISSSETKSFPQWKKRRFYGNTQRSLEIRCNNWNNSYDHGKKVIFRPRLWHVSVFLVKTVKVEASLQIQERKWKPVCLFSNLNCLLGVCAFAVVLRHWSATHSQIPRSTVMYTYVRFLFRIAFLWISLRQTFKFLTDHSLRKVESNWCFQRDISLHMSCKNYKEIWLCDCRKAKYFNSCGLWMTESTPS